MLGCKILAFILIQINEIYMRQTDSLCPDNHKYGFYMSSPLTNYNIDTHDSCMDPDENSYVCGRYTTGA